MAGYSIQGSYSTVQVLGPSLTKPIQYTTIQTTPSNVFAAIPLDKGEFDDGTVGPQLQAFADAIEELMQRSEVVGAIGNQEIDAGGLLTDYVTFTVQYSGKGAARSGVTAEADVPVDLLNFTDGEIGTTLLAQAEAIIQAAYDSLASAAGG